MRHDKLQGHNQANPRTRLWASPHSAAECVGVLPRNRSWCFHRRNSVQGNGHRGISGSPSSGTMLQSGPDPGEGCWPLLFPEQVGCAGCVGGDGHWDHPLLQGTATDYIGERAVGTGIAVSLTENQSQLFEAVPTCSAGSGVDVGLRGKIAECGRSAGCPTSLGTFPRKRVLLRLLWLLSLLPRTPMSFCLPFTHTVPLFPFGTLKTYPFHLASPNSMVICLGLSFLIHYQGYWLHLYICEFTAFNSGKPFDFVKIFFSLCFLCSVFLELYYFSNAALLILVSNVPIFSSHIFYFFSYFLFFLFPEEILNFILSSFVLIFISFLPPYT